LNQLSARAITLVRSLLARAQPRFRRVSAVAGLCLLTLLLVQCLPAPATPPPEELAASCGTFDSRPVRRVTYEYSTAPFQKDPFGGGKYIGKLLMDDAKPELDSDDTWARAVHREVREADKYYRSLQAAGYGKWDGCYGKEATQPILTSVVHHPSFTGFQGKPFAETFYMDSHVTQMAVTHELAHGVVERTAPLDDSQPETAAIWESLSDTFAALMVDKYDLRDINGIHRSLSDPGNPKAQGQGIDHITAYPGTDKYANAGILNKAMYLLVKGGTHPATIIRQGDVVYQPVAVAGIGKSRVERIYFHALNRDYLKARSTFRDFAAGVIKACRDLADSDPAKDIKESHCTQVINAFLAVGVLPPDPATATPVASPTVPAPTITPTLTPAPAATATVTPAVVVGPRGDEPTGLIAFTSYMGSNKEVFLVNPAGVGRRQLTRAAGEPYSSSPGNAQWLPDGSGLLYQDGRILKRINVDGTGDSVVQKDFYYDLTLAPDGSSFVTHSIGKGNDLDLFVSSLDDGAMLNITNHERADSWPAWSPDGLRIVFASNRASDGPKKDLYIVGRDGSNLVHLTQGESDDISPDWSPDGAAITYTCDHHICVINVDGSGLRQLTETINWDDQPTWSPDGNWIGFYRFISPNGGGIYIVRSDGTEERVVTQTKDDFEPQWSPR
jgi:hypothetical protein